MLSIVSVCLKNPDGDENSRFRDLNEWSFEGNSPSYWSKKPGSAGSKRGIFSPLRIFQTHARQRYFGLFLFGIIQTLSIVSGQNLGAQTETLGNAASKKALEFCRQNQMDSANFYIAQAARVFKKSDDLFGWLELHRNLAIIYRDERTDIKKAEFWYQDAIDNKWRDPVTSKEWKMWASVNLGIGYICYIKKSDFICARTYYELGRAILEDTLKQRDAALANVVLQPLGNIHARFRNFELAYYYLQEAQKICSEQKAWNKSASAFNSIGVMFSTRGEFQKAKYYYQEGLILPDLSIENIAQLNLNLAQAYTEMGNLDSSLQLTLTVKQLLEQSPDQFSKSLSLELWADLHENLGVIAQKKGDWAEASGHFHKYRDYYEQKLGNSSNRQIAQCNINLGAMFLDAHQPDSALFYAQIALQCLLPRASLDDVLNNPSPDSLYAENTLTQAFRLKINALQALLDKDADNQDWLHACLKTCDLLFVSDEILRREYAFDESKLYRQANARPYYEIAIQTALQLEKITGEGAYREQAFQYAELARERLLTDAVSEHELETMPAMPEDIRLELIALEQERARLMVLQYEKDLRGETSKSGVDSLESRLFKVHLAWKRLIEPFETPSGAIPRPPKTDLNAIKTALQPDQALLEYFVGDNALYIFLVNAGDLQVFQEGRTDSLERVIESLRKSLTDPQVQFSRRSTVLFGKASAQLYKWLLFRPLSQLSTSYNSLVVVPDRSLGYVPFEILGDEQGRIDFPSFPYLLRRFAVQYACSGNLWLAQNRIKVQTGPALLPFAGFAPKYAEADTMEQLVSRTRAKTLHGAYTNLPGAIKEVSEIATVLEGKAFIGEEASEQMFKKTAAQFRILHLAMHAQVDTRNSLYSKMLFANSSDAPPEDADLNAVELEAMRLPAEMAVVSACETGLGELRQGEGVISLSRAFFYAGVPATVVSLWAVSDESTATIMIDFYRNLKNGMKKDQALRLAKLAYLEQAEALNASPYYWAGFVASGNMNALFKR